MPINAMSVPGHLPHIGWAAEMGRALKLYPSHRLVLCMLADRADAVTLRCWPSVKQIMDDTGLSRRCVQMAIRALKDRNLIAVTYTVHSVSNYRLMRPGRDHAPMPPQPTGGAIHTDGGAQSARRGAQSVSKGAQNSLFEGATDAGGTSQEEPLREPPKGESAATPPPPRAGAREAPMREADIRLVIDAWNAMATTTGLTSVKVLGRERLKHLAARWSEHGKTGMLEAITKIGASTFCHGPDGGWRADFDFLMQAKSCTRAREGFYDDRTQRGPRFNPDNLTGVHRLRYEIELERRQLEAEERAEAAAAAGITEPHTLKLVGGTSA